MKNFMASIVIGSLLLLRASPVAADQWMFSGVPFRVAAATIPATDRDTYTLKARHEMHEWRKKLQDLDVDGAAQGRKEIGVAGTELTVALQKAEVEAEKLETVTADGWERAKGSFETASRELLDSWNRTKDQNK